MPPAIGLIGSDVARDDDVARPAEERHIYCAPEPGQIPGWAAPVVVASAGTAVGCVLHHLFALGDGPSGSLVDVCVGIPDAIDRCVDAPLESYYDDVQVLGAEIA